MPVITIALSISDTRVANAQAPTAKPDMASVEAQAQFNFADQTASPAVTARPHPAIIGNLETHVIQPKETLIGLSREHDLGLLEVLAVNPGIDPWLPGAGTVIVLPKSHLRPTAETTGIIVNLAELRLYYFPADGADVMTFAIGVGRDTFTTPIGETTVIRKQFEPTWYPTQAARADDPTLPPVVLPGPENPLGRYALYLGWPTYLIHGTNKPPGVGRRVSRGCIRMYPESISALFKLTPVGTKVHVVFEPVKMGWQDGELYLEVHPTHDQLDQLEKEWNFDPDPVTDMDQAIVDKAGLMQAWRLDWELIRAALFERRGIPIQITKPVSDEISRYTAPTPTSY